ncbi:MAG: Flp pilus assembly complex ATPase component TadA [Phycisphaerales bacterium]|nr:MAG: Flp pilus assembly complex ATPase component TadA [Phycisphaerales bacterium]
MPYLEVQTPQGKKRLELTEKAVTIGRLADNKIMIPDERASRHHCVVEPWQDVWRVRDLGSANGTKINNLRVTAEILDNGDVLRIGTTELRYIDPEQVAPRKRPNTPDFGVAVEEPPGILDQATLDLSDVVADAQTDYEKRLREIIDSAPEKPFDESDISLVDTRGVTIHQATSAGLDSGSDEDVGEGIRVFLLMLLACFRSRATDLHLEPRVDSAAIRIRVDGYMLTAVEVSMSIYKRILGVVKVLCEIDTSQRNVVQDGHFSVAVKGRRIDYRVSLTPSMHGQKLVVRVLDSSNAPSRLHELGLVPWMYEKLRTIAIKDAGLLLACGPTGCGKTTTLYSCLREIDVEQRNAITIEDPVEYYLEGCTQIPIDHKKDNTFANILRSVLRQDPDVIFVGEIRDIETATVAMQAAMTGHLVYTTVHSKDTIGAIFRLLDLGVESYLVANALNVILAQRLVRVLCEGCKKPVSPTPAQNMKMGHSLDGVRQVFVPAGCKRCLRTGFHGRRAIFELLEVDDAMRDVIMKAPSIQTIRDLAGQGLFMSLPQFGYGLVAQGICSMDEVDRVSGSE